MSETGRENHEIERFLRRAKLAEPSAELKERVTRAARQAWDQTAQDVPWQVPIRRLALSAAAAVLMISLANYYGDHARAGRESPGSAATVEEMSDVGDGEQVPYSTLVRHLTMTNRSVRNPAALVDYMEKLREMLRENEPPETPDSGAGIDYRSRLLPTQSRFCC